MENIIIDTQRLYLRPMDAADRPALCRILQDSTAMKYYEGPFTDAEVDQWLARQQERYARYGFGLWAVILKKGGEMIGQCGLTMQPWKNEQVLEIGYLFQPAYWHRGYASEAAQACKKYAFDVLKAPEVCSIIRDNDHASQRVAIRNGMRVKDGWTKCYRGVDMPHLRFVVQR